MRILNVSYPFAATGPDAIGGAEQILSRIDAALVTEGHKSYVLACAESHVIGEHLDFRLCDGEITSEYKASFYPWYRSMIEAAVEKNGIELVHFHGIDFHEYLPALEIPMLGTLHLPPEWYPKDLFNCSNDRLFLHCVSESQHARCPASQRLLGVIENGVPAPEHIVRKPRDFAFCLGRICPEKGYHLAMDAAKMAGVPLLIAGEVFPYESHQRYFHETIRPREDSERKFIGPLGLRRKTRFLSAARCLLVPSLVAETSSLVTMEALSCGTPVIAFRQGALPSLIKHGETGFLVDTLEEMSEAILKTTTISRKHCRKVAHARFSVSAMTSRYLARYRGLISGGLPKSTTLPFAIPDAAYAS